jgi:hypothetical protein
MTDSTGTRRVEVHFTTDDEALVVEVDEGDDGHEVDGLVDALEAVTVDEAEERLQQASTGARPIRRLGSYHRW